MQENRPWPFQAIAFPEPRGMNGTRHSEKLVCDFLPLGVPIWVRLCLIHEVYGST